MADLTAVVLAGGLGMGMRRLVADRPKVMTVVNEKPFLEHVLNNLNSQGMRRVVLCIGYMGDVVQNYFGSKYKELAIRYSRETRLLDTAGAVRFALPLIESDPCLILNGDSYADVDFEDFYATHLRHRASASMLLVHAPETLRCGEVKTHEDGRIAQFDCYGFHGVPGWINGGAYLLSRSVIADVVPAKRVSLERDVFPGLIGGDFYGYRSHSTNFIDIGVPEAVRKAAACLSQLSYAGLCRTKEPV